MDMQFAWLSLSLQPMLDQAAFVTRMNHRELRSEGSSLMKHGISPSVKVKEGIVLRFIV